MSTKKAKPKFRVGQAVIWCHRAWFIWDVLPLHCVGAEQCYNINDVSRDEAEFVSHDDCKRVSEEVMRPLTAREIGPRRKSQKNFVRWPITEMDAAAKGKG